MKNEKKSFYQYHDIRLERTGFFLPPILIGTIFYQGETLLDRKNPKNFSKEKAKKRIERHKSFAEQYKIPEMVEISATSSEAMKNYLEFYFNDYKPPIILGGNLEARIAGLEYLEEHGYKSSDYIYNSVTNLKNKKEIEVLKEFDLDSVVLLILGSDNMTSSQKYNYITKKRPLYNLSMIDSLHKLGIERIWIDGGVIGLESLVHNLELHQVVSSSLHLPVGTAPNNFLFKYASPRLNKKFHTRYRRASIMFIATLYSNFIFYGAIEDARESFTSAFQALEFNKIKKENNIKLMD
ncbi:MAG: hypothetical protein ACOC35_13385 [Promethearchaeia archaeon]